MTYTHAKGASDYVATGYQMIRSIEIENFRCYQHLNIGHVARINVIVGDNGSGKTALLEAMFLALSGSTEVSIRMRQQRGLGVEVGGTNRRIEDALWGDFFFDRDMTQTISVALEGDDVENRSIFISRGPPQSTLELKESPEILRRLPVLFHYKTANGEMITVQPSVRQGALDLPETGEDLPDFFFFPSTGNVSALENAGRFSDLRKENRQEEFIEEFKLNFPWIADLHLEVSASQPIVFADVGDLSVPAPNASGAVNRVLAILLAIASRPRSIVMIDEVENGLYWKNQKNIWKGLLNFARRYDSQLFMTTHSYEWLQTVAENTTSALDQLALWRIERGKNGPVVRQFPGEMFKAGIISGGELR